MPLQSLYAFDTKFMVAIFAVESTVKFSWFPLWLESYFIFVIHFLQSCSSRVPWCFWARLFNCLSILVSIDFWVSNIFCEGNRLVDQLLKFVVSASIDQWWNCLPSVC